MKTETQKRFENRELNQARSKPDTVNRPVRTAPTIVHHYNSTQYCNTETVLLIFPFLQTNITSQMWPSGGKEDSRSEVVLFSAECVCLKPLYFSYLTRL